MNCNIDAAIMSDQIDLEKLKKLQAKTKQGSKGAPRKKNVSKKSSTGSTDQKVATALKKLQVWRSGRAKRMRVNKTDCLRLGLLNLRSSRCL